MQKVFVLGLDGAPPSLIFERWRDELPNISALMNTGAYAKLKSCVPPSTILAWTSFTSGKDPSHFGVYSYTTKTPENTARLTDSTDVRCDRMWDILSTKNKRSIVLNVPLTYPASKLQGYMVTDFLTPSFNEKSTYPTEFKDEIQSLFNKDYMFDVSTGLASYKGFGAQELIEKVYEMTHMHFRLIKHMIKTKEWDFFMSVLIGTDRLQHKLWRFFDPTHRNFERGEYKDAVKEYYKYVDKEIGEIRKLLPENTTFIIASDHGFDRMDGRINLNDWLITNGYLILKQPLSTPTKFDPIFVDWEKTRAYAVGAYFGRIFFNKDILDEEQYTKLQKELQEKLAAIPDEKGNKLNTHFFLPQDVYTGEFIDEAPDLYVYFDDLRWGVNNDVGNQNLHSWSTIVGSDDAGHAPTGIFIINSKALQQKGDLGTRDILDMAPTILHHLNMDTQGYKGHPIK